jgi:2-dehydropantoate 2-reductase
MDCPAKIGIVGCGAVGSFYGAKLWRAGHQVHFLLRSDYAIVKEKGVWIESVDGSFQATPHCASRPEAIGICDLVLIGLKTTANGAFPQLLPPLAGPLTPIVTLQNGLGNEERLAAIFGPKNILHGLCFVCCNRQGPGHIRHTAYGRVILGEYGRPAGERAERLAEMLRGASIRCETTADLERANWEKLLWNIPFNGLGFAGSVGYDAVREGKAAPGTPREPCLTTDQLLADPRWLALVRGLMREIVATSRALGHPIAEEKIEINIERTRRMQAYKASTLLDFERGDELELESLFLEPLRRAQQAGVDTPGLRNLCAVLEVIANHRG